MQRPTCGTDEAAFPAEEPSTSAGRKAKCGNLCGGERAIRAKSQTHVPFDPDGSLLGSRALWEDQGAVQKVPPPGAAWVSLKTIPVCHPISLLLGRLSSCPLLLTWRTPGGWRGADHRNMSAGRCRPGSGCGERRTGRQMGSGKPNLSAARGANRQRAGVCGVISFKGTPATPLPDSSTGMAWALEKGTPVSLRGTPSSGQTEGARTTFFMTLQVPRGGEVLTDPFSSCWLAPSRCSGPTCEGTGGSRVLLMRPGALATMPISTFSV